MEGTPASTVSPSDGVLLVIYAFIGGLGMLGNGLVCLIFTIRRRAFGSVTNLLILNQSMIDLVDSVLFLILRFGPQFSDLGGRGGVWDELVCRLWFSEYIMWSLFIASTVNLLLVSLERYFAICHPVRHRSLFTVRRVNIGRGLVWLIGFSYQSYWAVLHRVTTDGECYAVWPSLTVQAILGSVFFCCEYLIPLSIMTFSYTSIVFMLRARSRRTTNANPFQRTKRNVTLTLCFVSVSYTVCWTPTEFSYLIYNMGNEYDFSSSMHYIFTVLVLLNMCINPLIYLIKYKRFQEELKKIFFRRCCGVNRVDSSFTGHTGTAPSIAAVASGGPWGVAPL